MMRWWMVAMMALGCGKKKTCDDASFRCTSSVLERCDNEVWTTFTVCEPEQTCTAQGAAIGCIDPQ